MFHNIIYIYILYILGFLYTLYRLFLCSVQYFRGRSFVKSQRCIHFQFSLRIKIKTRNMKNLLRIFTQFILPFVSCSSTNYSYSEMEFWARSTSEKTEVRKTGGSCCTMAVNYMSYCALRMLPICWIPFVTMKKRGLF